VGLEGGTVARGSLHHYVLPFEFACVRAHACTHFYGFSAHHTSCAAGLQASLSFL
jgi:hypothetical protein